MTEDGKETVNFRLGRRQKQALARMAAHQDRAVSELIRQAVEEYIEKEERRAWEAEARRQARAIAERALDPVSDERKTMDWIESVTRDMDWDR